jgi:hypothetical protein
MLGCVHQKVNKSKQGRYVHVAGGWYNSSESFVEGIVSMDHGHLGCIVTCIGRCFHC